MPDYPDVTPTSRKAWRAWLQKNHAKATGAWLVFAKKHSKLPTVPYNDAKKPETRANRVARIIDAATAGKGLLD